MPGLVQPLLLDQEQWRATLERVGQTPHHALGLIYIGDRDPDDVSVEDFPEYGCLVKVHAVNHEDQQLQVVAQGLSVRETEKLVRRLQGEDDSGKKRTQTEPKADPNVVRLENDLTEKLGARVKLQQASGGKGKLVINYNSLDELEGILEHIK